MIKLTDKEIKAARFLAAEKTNESKPLGIHAWNELRDSYFASAIEAAATEPLLHRIAYLEDSLGAWRRNAELADHDNRRLEEENKQLKKEIDRLLAAHESTVNLYSLASKKG